MNEEQIKILVQEMLSKAKVLHWIGAEALRDGNTLNREICVSVQGSEVFLAVKDDAGTPHFYPELAKVQDLINDAISGITDLDAKVAIDAGSIPQYLEDALWASDYIGLRSDNSNSLTIYDNGRIRTSPANLGSPSAGITRWGIWHTQNDGADLTDSFSVYIKILNGLVEQPPLCFELSIKNNLMANALWISKPDIQGMALNLAVIGGPSGFALLLDLPNGLNPSSAFTQSSAGAHAAELVLEQWGTPSIIAIQPINNLWIEQGYTKGSLGALTHLGYSYAATQQTEIVISGNPQYIPIEDLGSKKFILSQSSPSAKLVIPTAVGIGGNWLIETKGAENVLIQIQGGNSQLITPNQLGFLHVVQVTPTPAITFTSLTNLLQSIVSNDGATIDFTGNGTAATPLSAEVQLSSLGTEHIRGTQFNTPSGFLKLDANGFVPSLHLPSYVDDVLEFANQAAFPSTGETGKIYIALDTNESFRWSGSVYVKIGDDTATGTAGGDLTGSYPNPTIANNAISSAKIADNAVTTTKIPNDAVTNAKLANMAAYTIKANNTSASADPADYATATNTILGRRAAGLVNIPLTDPEFIKYQQTPLTDSSIVLVSSFGEYGIWIHPASGTFNTEGPRGAGNYFGTFQTIVDGNSTSRNYIQIYGDSVGVSIRGGDSADSGNITWSAWQQVGAGASTLPALTDVADDVSAADPAQDGEVLTWDNSAGNWQRKPIISNSGPVSAAVISHDINDTDNSAGFTRGTTSYNGGWGLSRASFDALTTQVCVGQGVGSSTSYTYAILEINSIANGGQTGTLKAKGSFTIPANAVGVQTLSTAFKVTKGKFYCLMVWAQQASSVSFLGKAGRTNFGVTFAFSSGSIPNGTLESTYSLNSDTTDRIWFSIEP